MRQCECTADDSAYATFQLEGGVIAHFNSSWVVGVRRDDLLTMQRVQAPVGDVVRNEPFPWTLLAGAKGVQLAENGVESWAKRAWVDVEPLEG